MNPNPSLNTTLSAHELMEMANLDVLGLLDSDERELFETSFRAASPGVQAQVRREQLRLTRMDTLLPDIEAPLGLRARVLAALREAAESLTPQRRGDSSTRAITGMTPMPRSSGVNRVWRIGAIASAAASIVFAFSTFQMRSDYQALADHLSSNALNDHILRDFGVKFDQAFFSSSARLVAFVSNQDSTAGAHSRATMLIEPASNSGNLFCKDLPGSGEYELVALNEAGKVTRVVATFSAPSSGIKSQQIQGVDLESSRNLAIRRSGTDELILFTRIA